MNGKEKEFFMYVEQRIKKEYENKHLNPTNAFEEPKMISDICKMRDELLSFDSEEEENKFFNNSLNPFICKVALQEIDKYIEVLNKERKFILRRKEIKLC